MVDTIAPELDRLPWLTDDRAPARRRSGKWLVIALATLGMAGVAALAFWIGTASHRGTRLVERRLGVPIETAPVIQQPAPAEPQVEEVQPVPMPEVELSPAPAPVIFRQQQEVRSAIEPIRERRSVRRSAPAARRSKPARSEAVAASSKPAEEKNPLSFSNPLGFVGSVRADGPRRHLFEPPAGQKGLVEPRQVPFRA